VTKKKLSLANNPLLSGPSFLERDRAGTPYREIPLEDIERDPSQPRRVFDEEKLRELADSILAYGVLSPILVRPSDVKGKYILVSGERRLRASALCKKKTIPAIVSTHNHQDGDLTLAVQLVENLQRADLSPLERAQAIGVLKENYNLSIREIAAKLGVSKSMVQRSLEILELPDDLLNALKEGASESKILLLSKIEDPDIRASYLKDLGVLTRASLSENIQRRREKVESADDSRITDEIRRALGLKAKISRTGEKSGRISIEFYSDSDLKEIYKRLTHGGTA
jgi:ParB family chromosome partitioning protein